MPTVAALCIPPEVQNTSGMKDPCSILRTWGPHAQRYFPSCHLQHVASSSRYGYVENPDIKVGTLLWCSLWQILYCIHDVSCNGKCI